MSAMIFDARRFARFISLLGVLLAVGCPFHPCSCQAQSALGKAEALNRAMAAAESKSEAMSAADVAIIVASGAVEAIPALERQFKVATDATNKVSIASGLVRLKAKDNTYWDFLLQQATSAVDSDIPDGLFPGPLAKTTVQSPEMQAWADANGVSLNTARAYALREFPSRVLALAMTADPRGLPLLRRALQSRDYLIVIFAAKGLVRLGDASSISLITAAAQRAPEGYRVAIAESLLFSNDEDAQRTAQRYLSEGRTSAIRGQKAQGMGVFGW